MPIMYYLESFLILTAIGLIIPAVIINFQDIGSDCEYNRYKSFSTHSKGYACV